ncbi:hypothetical protein ABG067_003334 [Albugo candida]
MAAWGLPRNTAPSTEPVRDESLSKDSVTAALKELKAVEKRDIFEDVEPVQCVQIEGVALLQIIKHCHEDPLTCVTGSLLGLEHDSNLEVTNSFPSPLVSSSATFKPNRLDSNEYQIEMMKHLGEVGMDNNKVGWYQSVIMGTYSTTSVIESQFQYQKSLGPNAICLLYDATETRKGMLSLKAFRLKKSFYSAYKDGTLTSKSASGDGIRSTSIIEELSIQIHNSDLIQCYVQQLVDRNESLLLNGLERLDLASNAYLETNLKNISSWADELAQEHFRFQNHERTLAKQRATYQQWQARQRDENKRLREHGREDELVPESDPDFFDTVNQPSKLESLLITNQMQTYCDQINRFAGTSFHKLFLASQIHKKE